MSDWGVEGLEAAVDGFRLGPVDLTLSAGRSLIVLGPSGAGKTSLLRAIAGFLPARGGRILRDGVDITHLPPERRRLGYVPQGLGLLAHRTVAENVRYPMELRDRSDPRGRTRELLERFHLGGLADRRPASLSGGEQQRVAIARALAAEPGLILWDEPWQALDVIARHELNSVWEELRAQDSVPVVVVTHDPALAFSIGDTFVVLEGGRVRQECSAPELLRRPADVFTARFIGLDNVYDRPALASAPAGGFSGWLRDRAGSGGLAIPNPSWVPSGEATGRYEGRVLQVRPSPAGVSLDVISDGLPLHLVIAPGAPGPFPRRGALVRFELDAVEPHPLGGDVAPPGGGA